MTLEEGIVNIDEVKARRLIITEKNNRLRAIIDVDPQRHFVPVQWDIRAGTKPMMRLAIKYREKKENGFDGFVVDSWQMTTFAPSGAVRDIYSGQVTSCALNGDIEDSRFSPPFPVGTHIVEERAGRRQYFIQTLNGPKEISKEEFGRKPSPAKTAWSFSRVLLVLANVAFIGCAGVYTARKRLQSRRSGVCVTP